MQQVHVFSFVKLLPFHRTGKSIIFTTSRQSNMMDLVILDCADELNTPSMGHDFRNMA